MLITIATIGDLTVSVHAVQAVDAADEIPVHYSLRFYDGVTDEAQTIMAEGERDAINLFAAWLVADEASLGVLHRYLNRLTVALRKGFLP